MRITGGAARGIPLKAPAGDAVRPATDAMRQAVFSSLGGVVVNAYFLDLFAGTGGYGLEALSRGAAGGVFIERNAKAAACLRANLTAVRKSLGSARRSSAPPSPAGGQVISAGGDAERGQVIAGTAGGGQVNPDTAGGRDGPDVILVEADVFSGAWPQRAPDLVFADPPYGIIAAVGPPMFAKLIELYPAAQDMLVIFEAPGEAELAPPGWKLLRRLGKGARQPTAMVFRRGGDEPARKG